MVGHGGSSAGSYLADPTSPIPSHCASIVVTNTLRVLIDSMFSRGWGINNRYLLDNIYCSCEGASAARWASLIVLSNINTHKTYYAVQEPSVFVMRSEDGWMDGWMNGVLGHFFALSRLNWARDNLDWWNEFGMSEEKSLWNSFVN